MSTAKYMPGQWVKVLFDRPENLYVAKGDIGQIVNHPTVGEYAHNAEVNARSGYLAIEFKNKLNINGAYGATCGVILPSSIEPIFTDEQLYEDDLG